MCHSFDQIFMMCGRSLTQTDIEIAKQAIKYNIPITLVRSQCDKDFPEETTIDGEMKEIYRNQGM